VESLPPTRAGGGGGRERDGELATARGGPARRNRYSPVPLLIMLKAVWFSGRCAGMVGDSLRGALRRK